MAAALESGFSINDLDDNVGGSTVGAFELDTFGDIFVYYTYVASQLSQFSNIWT